MKLCVNRRLRKTYRLNDTCRYHIDFRNIAKLFRTYVNYPLQVMPLRDIALLEDDAFTLVC